MTDDVLDLKAAAARAGVKAAALRQAIAAGRLQAIKADSPRGSYWLVTVAEIDRYIVERRPHHTHRQEGASDDQS